ncbi:MAG: DNA mismatch repair protein MutS [Anaerolineales bacterium]|nr:DNA mismatch repair protein MutS [Anaerolineales bacterium]
MSDLEPNKLRKQYLDIKRRYPNEILLFRLGDFYETFDDDAQLVARELELVLTSRPNMYKADGVRVPMAGIPHHALESYLARLIAKGYHVAICEQVGADEKGFFRREVVRVVTPGTVTEPNLLEAGRNNYLAALAVSEGRAGLAHADITTGDFAVTTLPAPNPWPALRHELMRLRPAELLLPEGVQHPALADLNIPCTPLPGWKFDPGKARAVLLEHFGVSSLAGFGLEHSPLATAACAAIVQYVRETQPAALNLLTRLSTYSLDAFMLLDPATRRNLELTETLRGGEVRGSLLGVLDQTVTAMGARLLRQWVNQPLLDPARINERLDRVAAFHTQGVLRAEVRAALKPLHDLERLTNRILGLTANPRDLVALRETLAALPALKERLKSGDSNLQSLISNLDTCADVLELLQTAIADEPPAVLGKPGIIRAGYSEELDGVISASSHAREWIAGLEKAEKERTGIKSLKVGYNKVFGYYLEISRGQSDKAPENYIRKQTLVNAERFITPELKEYETLVLNAEERILEIETRLFKDLCRQIGAHAGRLLTTARTVAQLDVLAALAEAAARNGYVRPQLADEPVLEIRDGRHPVVEQFLPAGRRFVPNDIVFEPGECVRVITGPNMSGKSTYLRQAALVVLMAQMGSFVPAASARLGVFDRIFTRIGAQDEIAAGQSTFMVEMVETANILHNATARSLLVLDEIGRGTSTYDGLSLAWAIVEHIHNHPKLKAKTLFATHYHELTDLAAVLPGVRNYNVAVAEEGDHVVFLHRIVPGGADRSYGIHVAQLAGLPRSVIARAQEILAQLEASGGRAVKREPIAAAQMALFPETSPLLDELLALDLNALTPMEALSKLFEWQARFGKSA